MTFANLRRVMAAAFSVAVFTIASALPAFAATVVTVNGVQITDVQIDQRSRLFRLEGNSSGTRGAQEQLITEAIQMTEAKRLGITVSNAQVDEAVMQIARNIKLSRDKLLETLRQGGISTDTLGDRLRAAIAWNAVVERAIMPQAQLSDLELEQRAASKISDFQQFDYILKEIIFVGQGASGRTAQANRYRSSFAGCDTAVDLSLAYTDAAVVDIGRRHATQLPDALARELAGLNVGGITKPRVIDSGVSMLAICEKAQASDLTFVKDGLQAEAGNDVLKKQVEDYLANLRKNAKIIYN